MIDSVAKVGAFSIIAVGGFSLDEHTQPQGRRCSRGKRPFDSLMHHFEGLQFADPIHPFGWWSGHRNFENTSSDSYNDARTDNVSGLGLGKIDLPPSFPRAAVRTWASNAGVDGWYSTAGG